MWTSDRMNAVVETWPVLFRSDRFGSDRPSQSFAGAEQRSLALILHRSKRMVDGEEPVAV